MAQSLFRPEAIEFQRNQRHWGNVVLLQPFSTKLIGWSAVTSLGVILVFLFIAPYSRKETVNGFLAPASGTAKVFAPQPGIIRTIHVQEGDEVAQGQPLLTIETNQIAADGEDVNASMLDTLRAQRNLLHRRLEATGQRAETEQRRLESLIRGLEAELVELKAQAALQAERIRISDGLVKPAAQLSAKRYMPETELKRRQEAVLEQRQTLNALNQQIASRESQMAETRYTLEQVPTVVADRVQSLRNDLSATEQRIAEINGRQAYVIRAPTSGRVAAVYATPGQTADPRHLQLAIMPTDASLEAELFVPTRAIGFVKGGQPVRILYEAFPYQSFGTYSGQIVKVTRTILTPSDLAVPVALKEPVYRVTATLDRPDIDAYGEKVPLQPGMLLKADIILERRSLVRLLLDPLLSART